MRLLFVLMMLAFLSCGSCVFNKSPERPERQALVRKDQGSQPGPLEDFIKAATVQKDWQRAFIEKMVEGQASQAWMLFSYAGYSNQGQFAIFQVGDQFEYYHAAANERANFAKITLAPETFAKFAEQVAAYQELPEYRRTSFDGVSYEFVHIRMADGKYNPRRIYMNSLGIDKQADVKHRELVELFIGLNK